MKVQCFKQVFVKEIACDSGCYIFQRTRPWTSETFPTELYHINVWEVPGPYHAIEGKVNSRNEVLSQAILQNS